MPIFQERHSKRFHITLQVSDLSDSIRTYSEILGQGPCCVIPQKLALWRTNELNFLLRSKPRHRTAVMQLGWEFDFLENMQRFKDCNLLSWLFFSTQTQDDAINRLNTEMEYDADNDALLELRNPNARWNLWVSLILLLGMFAFALFNYGWLQQFFRQPSSSAEQALQSQEVQKLQDLYSSNRQLQALGQLLEEADYSVNYLDTYGIAENSAEASITFQIINQQLLFSTYWSLRNSDSSGQGRSTAQRFGSGQEIIQQINNLNREAILCRYYLDEDNDIAVEALFTVAPTLLLHSAAGGKSFTGNVAESSPSMEAAQQQALQLWQHTLSLWQQESLEWLQESPLFGGSLEPRQSFSKK